MTIKQTRLEELRALAQRTLSENAIPYEDGFTALSTDSNGEYKYLKFCKKCHRWLPIESFNFMYKGSDKRQCYCKDCFKEYNQSRTERKHLEKEEDAERKEAAAKAKALTTEDNYARLNADAQKCEQQWKEATAQLNVQKEIIRQMKIDNTKKESMIAALNKDIIELKSHPANLDKATNTEIAVYLREHKVELRTLYGAIGMHHPIKYIICVNSETGEPDKVNVKDCAQTLGQVL